MHLVIPVLLVLASQSGSPYPPSPVIESVSWGFNDLVRKAPGSDLWPFTWADDDHLYTSWGDGGGFGGTNSDGRVSLGFARIQGPATRPQGVNVWGGKNGENRATFRGKTAGLLCVDGVLYAWINVQNRNPPEIKLAWSSDHAKSWQLAPWKFPEDDFFPATFLNCGKNYAGARDKYVYTYGGPWNSGPDHYLARVPQDQIRDRTAFQFFRGLDAEGHPTWTQQISRRRPVLSDPNGIRNIVSVVHNRGIKRYLATTSHGVQVGQLAIFDAPEPWGPWTTVAYYDNWGGFGRRESLVYAFPTKWISPDGTTLWCVFSAPGVWL